MAERFVISEQNYVGHAFRLTSNTLTADTLVSTGPGERARPRAHRHARPRGAIGKTAAEGRWRYSMSAAERTRHHPAAGAVPEHVRCRAIFQKPKRNLLVEVSNDIHHGVSITTI